MEKTVEIQTDGGLLRGMIHYPPVPAGTELAERYPVVAAFHGFEGTRMGSSSFFVALSRSLAKAGFASVRFDFLGSGESEGEFSDMTVSRELEDARRILEWTAGQPGIDGSRTALLGHSMGASITGILAGLMEEGKVEIEGIEVRTLALLAPAGEIRDRIDEEMAARGLRIKVDTPEFWGLPFPIPVRGGLIGRSFFEDLRRYEVMRLGALFRKPVLLVQGDADHMVPLSVCEDYASGMEDCALHMIRGAGHNFNDPIARDKLFRILAAHLENKLRG